MRWNDRGHPTRTVNTIEPSRQQSALATDKEGERIAKRLESYVGKNDGQQRSAIRPAGSDIESDTELRLDFARPYGLRGIILLNRESKPIMQAKARRQLVIERPLGCDPDITPLESRWTDIFVEINQTVRLERAQELHKETLQPRNVMR